VDDATKVADYCPTIERRKPMKCLVPITMTLAVLGAPAFSQMEVTCGDYALMDNAKQMETIAALESETSQMATEQNLTAEAIHQKLAADCQGKVDVLVVDVIEGW
jgi:hypothetical protein